ncbi:hypothetical protein KP509_27G024100 [Ceratopteris richardii]|uniref:RING-type domain-containing protein n=1 Tax=Ceratopteris richardii TaxID=49495 RepID=A0A8T2RG18_CERRI|nr:hypothetical protein KP509_27G024100 [Ceratopteris richardii]
MGSGSNNSSMLPHSPFPSNSSDINNSLVPHPPSSSNSVPTAPISADLNLIMTTLGFLLSAIFIVFIMARLLCARIQSRRSMSGHAHRIQACGHQTLGVDPFFITLFPTIVFVGNVFASLEDATCAICLGEYAECDPLRILPQCGHTFHVWCIDAWLRRNASCPVCRIRIQSTSSRRTTPSLISQAARSRFIPGALPETLFEQPLQATSEMSSDLKASPCSTVCHGC